MRVHHINCGTLRPPLGRLVDGKPGLFRRATMVCHCLLIETATGLVLAETGMGTPVTTDAEAWLGRKFVHLTRPDRGEDQTAVHQIRKLGFDPADVRDIVLTHLDLDHAGGLVDFPQARVHVYATELAALGTARYRSVQFAHGPQWTSYADSGEPWFGFDAVRPLDGLPEEILLIPLAGHTLGHAGIAVDTGNGWLLNAGDSYFHPGELEPRPHIPAGLGMFESLMQTDRAARLDNQRRLRELVQAHRDEVTVFSAHSALEFDRISAGSRR